MIINAVNLERGMKKAVAKALNNTADQMKQIFIKTIQRKYGLTTQGAVYIADTRMQVIKATPENLKAALKPSRRVVPLIFFNAVQDRSMTGTQIEVLRGKKEILPHTFIPRKKSGELYKSPSTGLAGVFKRIGSSARQHISLQGGVPFKQMFMESIPEADKMKDAVLERNIQKEITKQQRTTH
jgi:hypothetical protein